MLIFTEDNDVHPFLLLGGIGEELFKENKNTLCCEDYELEFDFTQTNVSQLRLEINIQLLRVTRITEFDL